jgi:hypothetical protein
VIDTTEIRNDMDVVGSDGQHVGSVDHMEGGTRIKLRKSDPAAQGQHHYIPVEWVQSVEGRTVRLSKSSEEARREWDRGPTTSGKPS